MEFDLNAQQLEKSTNWQHHTCMHKTTLYQIRKNRLQNEWPTDQNCWNDMRIFCGCV